MNMTAQTEKEFALVVLTEDGTIVDAHDACKDSFGWNRENLAGQDIGTLLPAHRGLLISGILQSVDSQAQLGEEPNFSMRILAQRIDESSFPAMVRVRRFGESDCWTASFFHAEPLTPPDPSAPSHQEEITSEMICTPLEENIEDENPEVEPSDSDSDSSSHGTPVAAAEASTGSKDEALAQPPLPEDPATAEQPKGEKDQLTVRAEAPSHDEPANRFETDPAKPAAKTVLPPLPSKKPPTKDSTLSPKTPAQDESPAPSSAPTAPEPGEHHLLDRITFLTSQITSLHSELREHVEVQARTQKKLNTFEEQLQETKKSLALATGDLAKQKSEAASGELESTRTLNKVLEEQLALYKSANEALQRTDTEAANQLNAVAAELKQARAALAQETAKRHELERKLTGLEQERFEQERKSKLEICRLDSALKAKEPELKQLELSRSLKPQAKN